MRNRYGTASGSDLPSRSLGMRFDIDLRVASQVSPLLIDALTSRWQVATARCSVPVPHAFFSNLLGLAKV
jgi:hypothetical protein